MPWDRVVGEAEQGPLKLGTGTASHAAASACMLAEQERSPLGRLLAACCPAATDLPTAASRRTER